MAKLLKDRTVAQAKQGAPIRLRDIVEGIRNDLTVTNQLRDETLNRSRSLIRSCAESIRAIHRHEWAAAEEMLRQARLDGNAMVAPLAQHPALYHAGYTQDALKELVEAHLLFAVVRGGALPAPAELQVTGSTYLRGMSEAGTEMRRFVLDMMRQGEIAAAEPYLEFMDEVYSLLITVDFPDAITDGLRRHTDVLRNVLERTRGDLTLGMRQEQMRQALRAFEEQLAAAGLDLGPAGEMGDLGSVRLDDAE
jgi:translin